MKWSEPTEQQINALIAEKVMGLDPVCKGPLRCIDDGREGYKYYCRECGCPITVPVEYFAAHGLPERHQRNFPVYDKDLNAVWQVIDQVVRPPTKSMDVAVELRGTRFMSWFEHANLWAMSAEEAASAICKRVLQIYGVKIEK